MAEGGRRPAPQGEWFDFEFAPLARVPLALLSVSPARCGVLVGATHLHIRFGPIRTTVARDNVRAAEVIGPFSPWKALGPRLSLKDRGLTFGTTARRGVCILLRRPIALLGPLAWLRHPAITVTVTDADRLAAALHPSQTPPASRPDAE